MWLEFVDRLFADLDRTNPLIEAAHFFLYDTVKIFFLLATIIFIVTLLRSYFPTEKIRDYLVGKSPLLGNILAAFFGIITPFCTCSAIPLFLGFLQARVPLGVTFSYLISAPMNNEIAIAMLFALFGWKIAAIYIAFGLIVAIVGGYIIGRLNMESDILITVKPGVSGFEGEKIKLKQRVVDAIDESKSIIKKVWLYVVIGIAIGAFIHGYVPTEFITKYAGGDSWYAVPLSVILGVPIYSNAAGVMPLVEVLVDKGMLLGSALAFMMAITALSLPEFMILKKILKTRLIVLFFGIVATGIVATGYLFNAIL